MTNLLVGVLEKLLVMNPKELRLVWRRAQAAKMREERVITAYVEANHPEIYTSAAVFYNKLNKQYPKKPDLRKTKEFKAMLSGNNTPTTGNYQEKAFPNITVNVQPTFVDNLQLRIPLLSPQATSVQSPSETMQLDEIPQHEVTVRTTEDEEEESSSQMEETVDLASIDDSVLEEIMDGLREDPDLHTFFDDWDFESDDCPLW